jgi:hypothetical protein
MKRYSIVGQKNFGFTDSYMPGVTPGTPVTLVREPTNGYDPNAVQVWIYGKMVGYIPKTTNAPLARFIDCTGKSWADTCAEHGIAFDANGPTGAQRTIKATFVRSTNSAYPQVEVDQ